MSARNTQDSYGWVARGLHWLVAIAVFAMFGLGLWMRSLDYYHPWYQPAPDLHISIGFLLMGGLAVRILWAVLNPKPRHIGSNTTEQMFAKLIHFGLYVILIAVTATGYLYALSLIHI